MPVFENIEQFETKGRKRSIPPIAPHSSTASEYMPRRRPGMPRLTNFSSTLPDPVHVDIDPIKAEDLEREYEKADKLLRAKKVSNSSGVSFFRRIKGMFRRWKRWWQRRQAQKKADRISKGTSTVAASTAEQDRPAKKKRKRTGAKNNASSSGSGHRGQSQSSGQKAKAQDHKQQKHQNRPKQESAQRSGGPAQQQGQHQTQNQEAARKRKRKRKRNTGNGGSTGSVGASNPQP